MLSFHCFKKSRRSGLIRRLVLLHLLCCLLVPFD
jgi:hypothetical protein